MTSQKMSGSGVILDPLPASLDDLGRLATTVLGEHIAIGNLCAVCGSSWPCSMVVLADHNLEAAQPTNQPSRQGWRRGHPDARRQSCLPAVNDERNSVEPIPIRGEEPA